MANLIFEDWTNSVNSSLPGDKPPYLEYWKSETIDIAIRVLNESWAVCVFNFNSENYIKQYATNSLEGAYAIRDRLKKNLTIISANKPITESDLPDNFSI